MDGKFIGLILAICSSILIGTSFVITKKGLQRCRSDDHGDASDSHRYLKSPIWWCGLCTMVCGELLNFVGYTFAPAILITPLGAISVIIGALLASIFLKERLGPTGIVGCLLSLIGAIIIVLHSPEDPVVDSVDELVSYMLQPAFIVYFVTVLFVTIGMIWKIVPRWGKTRPIVFITICSLVGSLSIMAIKAFGIAVRLTIAGNNQFTQVSTYVFGFMCLVFILTQMNYFNKALDTFSTNVVNPIYFVFFTSSTIIASAIMYRGWHTANAVSTVTLICGFFIIFAGVYLLNSIARKSTEPASTNSMNHAKTTSPEHNSINDPSLLHAMASTSTDPLWNSQDTSPLDDEEKCIGKIKIEHLDKHLQNDRQQPYYQQQRHRAYSIP